MKRKYRRPLSRHIFIGCVLFALLFSVVLGTLGYLMFKDSITDHYEEHIYNLIHYIEKCIDTDDMLSCLESGKKSEKFEETSAILDNIIENNMLDSLAITKPVYNDGEYDVIQVMSGLRENERKYGVSRREAKPPLFGESMGDAFPDEMLPGVYQQFMNSKDVEYMESRTDYGDSFMGVYTLKDKNGDPGLVLTAGVSFEFLQSTMNNYLLVIIIASVILAFISILIMMLWFKRRIIKPLHGIEEAAAEFEQNARKSLESEALVLTLPEIHTGDEFESLFNTLTTMSQDMKEYVGEMLMSAAIMESMENDLNETKNNVVMLGQMAVKDPLTGIRNKTGYDQEVAKIIEGMENGDTEFGVAMVDLNFLKKINDTYGHDKGNVAIIKLCHLVCEVFKHSPVFRVGGDEFVIIIRGNDYENSYELEEQFNNEIEKLSHDQKLEPWERISAAIGIAMFDSYHDKDYDGVFRRADMAMYDRKRAMKAMRED